MLRHAFALVIAAGLTGWTMLTADPTAMVAAFTRLALLVVFFLPVLNAAGQIFRGPPPT